MKPGQENAAEKFVSAYVDTDSFSSVEGVETGPAASLSNTHVLFSLSAVGSTGHGLGERAGMAEEKKKK